MAGEIFVDTSGFYALLVKKDEMHRRAAEIMRDAAQHRARFTTTDYVLDETVTLLCARGHGHLVDPLLAATLESKACEIEWTGSDEFSKAASFLTKHLDQGWSFTDCVSFRCMKSRRQQSALTKDEHFEKAGFRALLR